MANEQKGDLVEDIKDRLSIEDVVGDYLELKRAGRNLKANSPFNAEKTPSFMVSPEKQIWHDFSSGKGGTMFGFVMEMEGVDFRGSLEILARKASLDISQYRSGTGGTEKKKKRIYEALELATKFYMAQLAANKFALEYVVKKRGFNKESIQNFRLGYSPKTYTALTDYLKNKGFKEDEIKDAGLGVIRRSGFSDMFGSRMMIPLMDPQGQVIGFTARQIIDNKDSPKYINTPQTLVYDKSRHVYGFSQAKEAIRRAGYGVLVEGNLDVISSHQAGIKNVAATAGTAMTAYHLKTIGRMAGDVRLAFDSDKAGVNATERAISIAQEVEVQLSVVSVPDGQDPDDLVRQDPAEWQKVIAEPIYAIDWLYDRYAEIYDITSAKGKRDFTDVLLKVIKTLKDDVEKDHYLRKLAKDTDVSNEAMASKMASLGAPRKSYKRAAISADQNPKTDPTSIEDQFLGLLLLYPTTRRVAQTTEEPITFTRPGRQEIFDYLVDNPQAVIDDLNPPQGLNKLEEYVKIAVFAAEHHYKDFGSNERLREASDLATRLIKNGKVYEKQLLIKQLKEAEDSPNEVDSSEILKRIDEINRNI